MLVDQKASFGRADFCRIEKERMDVGGLFRLSAERRRVSTVGISAKTIAKKKTAKIEDRIPVYRSTNAKERS
jgi:hypothetical protein